MADVNAVLRYSIPKELMLFNYEHFVKYKSNPQLFPVMSDIVPLRHLNFYIYFIYFSLTLYLVYCTENRGNLVLRHSVSQAPPDFQKISCFDSGF